MFMRILQVRVNLSTLDQFRDFYHDTIIPELQKLPGCLFAGLNQSGPNPEEFISLTFWESQKYSENYEKSGVYEDLVEIVRPYLAEAVEWKIQLSENLELEYKPVPEEPIVKQFNVTTQTEAVPPLKEDNARMYVRIVSLQIESGKTNEFKILYNEEILPVLKLTHGCLYAYLTENLQSKREYISVTVWDSKEDADRYEQSGRFQELVDRVKHTFSKLYQWKMVLETDFSKSVKTNDDLTVKHFNMIAGKNFIK